MIKLVIYLFICCNYIFLESQRIYNFLYILIPRDNISFINKSTKFTSYKIIHNLNDQLDKIFFTHNLYIIFNNIITIET